MRAELIKYYYEKVTKIYDVYILNNILNMILNIISQATKTKFLIYFHLLMYFDINDLSLQISLFQQKLYVLLKDLFYPKTCIKL